MKIEFDTEVISGLVKKFGSKQAIEEITNAVMVAVNDAKEFGAEKLDDVKEATAEKLGDLKEKLEKK